MTQALLASYNLWNPKWIGWVREGNNQPAKNLLTKTICLLLVRVQALPCSLGPSFGSRPQLGCYLLAKTNRTDLWGGRAGWCRGGCHLLGLSGVNSACSLHPSCRLPSHHHARRMEMNPAHSEELLCPSQCPGLGRTLPLTPLAVCHQEVILSLKCSRWTGHTLGRRAPEDSIFTGKLQAIKYYPTSRCHKDDGTVIVRMRYPHIVTEALSGLFTQVIIHKNLCFSLLLWKHKSSLKSLNEPLKPSWQGLPN